MLRDNSLILHDQTYCCPKLLILVTVTRPLTFVHENHEHWSSKVLCLHDGCCSGNVVLHNQPIGQCRRNEVRAYLGVAWFEAEPELVWWGKIRYYYALGSVFRPKFLFWMVLVVLERGKDAKMHWFHAEKLSSGLFLRWLRSHVQSWILWSKSVGRHIG